MSRRSRNLFLLLAVVLGLCGQAFAADTMLVISGTETQVSGAWATGQLTISFGDRAGKITYSETVYYGQFSTPASIASAFGAKFSNDSLAKTEPLCAFAVGNAIYFHLKGSDTFGMPSTSIPSAAPFAISTSAWQGDPLPSNPKTQVNVVWTFPAAGVPYGTPLSALQAYANTGGVAGTFTYPNASGSTLTTLGNPSLAYTFTPSDTADYKSVSSTVPLNVIPATPIIVWSDPAPITHGTALSATQLNAYVSVNGTPAPCPIGTGANTCSYSPGPTTVLAVGPQKITVTYTPPNSVDYYTATATVILNVTKVTPTITWPLPASIPANTVLSADLLNASSTVPSTFVYSPGANSPPLSPGDQLLTVTATPNDTANYAIVTMTVPITVVAGSTFDTRTVTLTVGGASAASYTYGATDTPSSVAEGLADASSSSLVTVTAVDSTLNINATATGSASNYAYSLSILPNATTNTTLFPSPSFAATPASGNLDGGVSAGSGVGQTVYQYTVPSGGYDPAGNLLSYTDTVMGTWTFNYDTLNRLAGGAQVPVSGSAQFFCWQYDAFGNRLQQEISPAAFQSGGGPLPCANSATLTTDLASYYPNNQIISTNARGVTASPGYDLSGNITYDGANQYLYDGEGRVCAVYSSPIAGISSMIGYLYDADGTRVAKGSITTWSCDPGANGLQITNDYVLGLGGEQVAELGMGGAAKGSSTTGLTWQHTNVWAGGKLLGTYDKDGLHFYLDDPLGTRRAQTDYAGVLEQTCSSLPYGDGLSCTGGELQAPTEHHFTGKERDTESGNDYFGARYYSSAMGRFMSPDWSAKAEPVPYAKLDNPQSLNLYAYVGNNPMGGVDDDGHDGDGQQASGSQSTSTSGGSATNQTSTPTTSAQSTNHPTAQAQQQNINQAPQYSGQSWGSVAAGVQYESTITVNARATVVPNPESLVGHDLFGNGQCYALGVAFGMPASHLNIHPGDAPDATTPIGTIIGTFAGKGGTYNNVSGQAHIAIFDGFYQTTNSRGVTTTGIHMIDQWSSRPSVGYSDRAYGAAGNYESNAANYRIVLGP